MTLVAFSCVYTSVFVGNLSRPECMDAVRLALCTACIRITGVRYGGSQRLSLETACITYTQHEVKETVEDVSKQ